MSSSSYPPRAKRRRSADGEVEEEVDEGYDDEDVQPPAADGAVAAVAAGVPPPPVDGSSISNATPDYDEIGKILFVDIQKESATDVEDAFDRLDSSIATVDAPNPFDCSVDTETYESAAAAAMLHNASQRKNREMARTLGGHSLTIVAMRKWKLNASIQCHGCRFLRNYLFLDGRRYAIPVLRSGGVETSINAMKNHPTIAKVHSEGMGLLLMLFGCIATEGEDDEILKYVRRFIHQLDGIDLLVQTMERFPNSLDLATGICALLKDIAAAGAAAADNGNNNEFCAELNKAVPLVRRAISKYGDEDDELKEDGTEFLHRILADSSMSA